MGFLRTADLAALAGAPFTYPEVGRHPRRARCRPATTTASGRRRSAPGRAAFDRAAAAIFDWRLQRGTGLRVRAGGRRREAGAVVVLTAGLPWFGYDIPCRVVWAQTEGDEQGFGYGRLPGHPESGEECFVVTLRPDGDVVFTTRVFSRLATPLARLGGPVSRMIQRAATEGYGAAAKRAAGG